MCGVCQNDSRWWRTRESPTITGGVFVSARQRLESRTLVANAGTSGPEPASREGAEVRTEVLKGVLVPAPVGAGRGA